MLSAFGPMVQCLRIAQIKWRYTTKPGLILHSCTYVSAEQILAVG